MNIWMTTDVKKKYSFLLVKRSNCLEWKNLFAWNFDKNREWKVSVRISEKAGGCVRKPIVAHRDWKPLVEHVQTSKKNRLRIKEIKKRHFFDRILDIRWIFVGYSRWVLVAGHFAVVLMRVGENVVGEITFVDLIKNLV